MYRICANGDFTLVSKPCPLRGARFNDGKVGPDGRLYLGTFSRDYTAAFYRMESNGTLTELFDGVGNSNGLDWSPDGKTFYYNDTPTGRTDAFDFDVNTGTLSARREVFHYSGGNPDGMTIDCEGNLWTAVWGSNTVVCVDPVKGKVLRKIELPVSQIACCAFAGDDMKTLVITTAAHGMQLKDEPLAGSVFAMQMDVAGVKTRRFKLSE
jgi:sugar lactone lactonase YvrE